jgi:hypothetical protein
MIKDRQLQGEASPRVTMDPTGGADNSLSCASDFRMDHAPLKKKIIARTATAGFGWDGYNRHAHAAL